MKFYPAQQEAIKHKEGPMLTLAGPGSGKTAVITERIRYLIEEYKVNPAAILVVTFTRAAAWEMQKRFEGIIGGRKVPVTFGTFHSVFYNILKSAYRLDASNILREEQRYRILTALVREHYQNIEDEKELIDQLTSDISRFKMTGEAIGDETIQAVYQGYQSALKSRRLLDFDDMLLYCKQLFERSDRRILEYWQQRFAYILVDEFQDINQIQYDVVKKLAMPQNNLFVVGDDDQSIYHFRGARPEIILNFEQDFAGAGKIFLNYNFRSTKNIIAAADKLILHNEQRFPKKIKHVKETGDQVDLKGFDSREDECRQILQLIKSYRQIGYRFEDMAILYRTNTQPRYIIEKLSEHSLPFRVKEGMPDLYSHWIAKDIFSYLALAESKGGGARSDYFRVMNRPNRYLSRACFDKEQVSFQDIRIYYRTQTWIHDRIDKFQRDLQMLKGMPPFGAVRYIRDRIGYQDYVREFSEARNVKADELIKVLDELEESARPFQTCREWLDYIRTFQQELQKNNREARENQQGITLLTMHGSKGLEYEIVFMLDCNDGITPHPKAESAEEMEEERRMFYVAMTRAKTYLHIYWIRQLYGKTLRPSVFVDELSEGQ